MDRTCVRPQAALRNQRSLVAECTDPQRWRPSGGNPRHERGVLRARLLRPAGRHAMVVAHLFESGQRRRLTLARVESGTANGRRSSAGQHRVHSCDRRKGLAGHVGSPGSRVPQREPALPTETAREAEYARRKVESSFGAGGWIAAQLRPPGTGCSPGDVP